MPRQAEGLSGLHRRLLRLCLAFSYIFSFCLPQIATHAEGPSSAGRPECRHARQNTHPQFSYLNRLNSSLQTKDIVCSPTRCTATSSKCLDVILTNVHFFKKGAVMEDLDISDHALVYCCGHFPGRGGNNFKYAQTSRNWRRMNVAVFEQALDTQLQGLDTTGVDSMWTEWRNKFLAALDEAAPKKIIKNNRKRKKHCPWMSPELLHLLHQQKSLHRRIKKTHHQQQDIILRHRKLRNRTNNLYRQLKKRLFLKPTSCL